MSFSVMGRSALEGDARVQVVAAVLADARQVLDAGDAEVGQPLLVADAGQLEKLRDSARRRR